jgi:hypothetical protein
VNRAIANSINISFNPQQGQQNASGVNYQGGRQLINIVGPEIPQKGNTMTFDFTKPPPTFTFAVSFLWDFLSFCAYFRMFIVLTKGMMLL